MNNLDANGVLLVDPDPTVRSRLQRELEARGWRVWTADDGPAALRVFTEQQGAIRAAVVDLQLPGLQGAKILAELGAASPAITLVATAADISPYTAAAFRRLSPTPLFAKPVRAGELETALRAPAPAMV